MRKKILKKGKREVHLQIRGGVVDIGLQIFFCR